ncbi:MAG: YfhO family protein, partial [Bacilli bacterium]|nr:YfhO family protein [Bacilli bacterium]
MKKNYVYLLAFFVPIIIILGYTIYQEIKLNHNFFSNGETFIVGDLHQQYISIYSNIKDILQGNASLFYSFNKDIGNEMITTISYYGMSPFNIMYIFIRKVDIPFFTFIIYLFKIGLCSTFSLYFFNYKYGKSKSHIIFALLYAFCGYCVIYYFHLMWLDVVYMTPLVLIGINKLIADKPLMYIITLSLSIIFNFYIAYMLYIFCVLYFIYELLIKYNIRNFQSYKNIILKFIKSSVLAIGISCIII